MSPIPMPVHICIPLSYALFMHYLHVFLLQNGRTPLHYAAAEGHIAVVQALLEDPRVNLREKDNVRDILRYAVQSGGSFLA